MKTYLRSTMFAGFILASAAVALAAPRSKQLPAGPQAGSRDSDPSVAYTCNQCMGSGQNGGMAMTGMDTGAVCRTGDAVQCPSCNVVEKTAAKGRPATRVTSHKSVLVNQKGERCEFYAVATQSN